jgi:sirohydrochlorin cobaltochelatase
MNAPPFKTGIVIIAHGSRDPLWHKPIAAVIQRIGVLSPDTPVACAYLELSTPDLTTATLGLMTAGVTAISIFPLFLGVGKHAREDVPRMIAVLANKHPEITFTLKPTVGEDTRVVELLAQIALEDANQTIHNA